MKKRFVSLLVAACMIFALLPVSAITAFAKEPVLTGYCGADSSYPSQTYNYSVEYKNIERTFTGTYYSNAIWTLTPNGENTYKLTISGTGAMGDLKGWAFGNPWNFELIQKLKVAVDDVYYAVTELEIADGITEIGAHAFEAHRAITHVALPQSVTKIGEKSFNYIKISLTYDDDVTSVMLNGKELTEKEYTISELMGQNRKLDVTYGKAGTHTFGIVLKNGDKIVSECSTDIVVVEKAAELTPATKLYTLTVKNADVTIQNGDEEIKAEKNDKGELIAKVPEKADVTVTYTSQSDAVAFDQWTITTDETLDVDVKNNPLKFQMPAGGVTIEAMTKDASIEEDEPNILGTAAVVGTAAAGTAILAWQGYQLGTELYLKTALPAGTAIPTNRAELALLVWNHAGKPAPAAVLPADATDTQKAIAWAVENDLLKAAKDNGETYVDTDSVSRVEVIRVWNKAQEK